MPNVNTDNPTGLTPSVPAAQGLADPKTPTTVSEATFESPEFQKNVVLLLEQSGFTVGPDGSLVVKDTAAIGKTGEVPGLSNAEQVYGTGETQLKPPAPPKIGQLTPEARRGAETFATNLDKAFDDAYSVEGALLRPPDGAMDQMSRLSGEHLLAAFLKLNLNDPNNSPETQNRILELSSKLRQLALDEASRRLEKAAEAQKQAAEYAEKVGWWAKIGTVAAGILMTVGAVVLVATSWTGIGLVVGAALIAVGALLKIGLAALEYKAAEDSLAAQEEVMDAKRFEKLAMQFQDRVQSSNDVMKLMMESKNQTVESVLKMLQAGLGVRLKLLSAQMAR